LIMKFSKKTLLMAASIVLCMTMTAIGTVAYLTDRAAVANTFTVGNIDIIVDETMVDQYGQPTEGDWRLVDTDGDDIADTPMNKEAFNEWKEKEASSETPTGDYDKEFEELEKPEEYRTENNDYKLIPGMTYIKDPTMTVMANSENAYVRMLLTVTYLEAADEVLADHNYIAWFDFNTTDWFAPQLIKTEKADGKITRVFEARYKNIVEKPTSDTELAALFTTISIPGALDNTELATLEGFQVDLTANAIQAVGFADADAAWLAFNEQVNP